DPVQRLGRLAAPPVGQFLGIAEGAEQPFDDTRLATDIIRSANVAEGKSRAHAHPIADAELSAHMPPSRDSISANLRPSSSTVMTPFWIRLLARDVIQRS